MWFRNLQIYRLTQPFTCDPLELERKLAHYAFIGCGSLDPMSKGWTTPGSNPDSLVYARNGQILVALRVEQKLLPGAVVRQHAEERARQIEQQQGYRPGRKQLREIRDDVETELLPRAFGKQRTTYAWIDPLGGWLVVDAANPAKAEEVLELLHKAVDDLAVLRPKTELSPRSAMTDWLLGDAAPAGFTIDRDCELMSPLEEKATVRFVRHPLDAADIRHHIEAGKLATRLALTWNDRVSFVLTEDFQVKRLAFLDLLKEEADKADNVEEQFDADFALMSGELARFIPDLIEALGGESALAA
ncbi:MAG: recombination-associated protein RdgC [Sulfuricella sp.]|nr:recombination-associated protein RdgC [Sulfuricella sp.]